MAWLRAVLAGVGAGTLGVAISDGLGWHGPATTEMFMGAGLMVFALCMPVKGSGKGQGPSATE